MATAKTTTKKSSTTKAKSKPAPAPEVEAPAKVNEVTFGASDLAKHLSEGREKPVTAREIRTLIRKMARDGSGRVQREIIAGNRSRYDWSGVDDPEVQAIIAAFNNGELEADKQEKLQALKERKAAQKAAGETVPAKGKKASTKKAKVVEEVEEDDDEELELDEDDDDE
jgi:hypothetical protein